MKNNRKGFTTVELVIVIAVIAILAAVLIPTFSNLITKANDSAALQEARATLTSYMVEHAKEGSVSIVVKASKGNDDVYFAVEDSKLDTTKNYPTADAAATAAGIADVDNTGENAATYDYVVVEKDSGTTGFKTTEATYAAANPT